MLFRSHPRVNRVVFGKDGKPFYVAGPYDDERKSASVLSRLKRTIGDGNYDFIAGLYNSPDLLEDETE